MGTGIPRKRHRRVLLKAGATADRGNGQRCNCETKVTSWLGISTARDETRNAGSLQRNERKCGDSLQRLRAGIRDVLGAAVAYGACRSDAGNPDDVAPPAPHPEGSGGASQRRFHGSGMERFRFGIWSGDFGSRTELGAIDITLNGRCFLQRH